MRRLLRKSATQRNRQRTNGRAPIGLLLGLLVGAGLGLAAGALWPHRSGNSHSVTSTPSAAGETQGLSEGTKAILKRLQAPAQLKLYSTIDPANAPDDLKQFARRLDQLLSLYQQESNGKIVVTRLTSLAYTNTSAAVSEGIKPFTLNNDAECVLGLAVLYKGHRESVPQLVPEWEAAMEIDISRAIQNAVNSAPASGVAAMPPKMAAAVTEDLKQLIPNFESVSLADGTRILRDAALKESGEAVKNSQAQLKEAQQQLSQAQNGGTEADQQAAMKHLQEVQNAQSEQLRQIAAKSRIQIEALRALKGAGQ